MKVYTKSQLEALCLKFYFRGLEDGRLPRDRQAEIKPPTLDDLGIAHPLTSSDDKENMAHKRPWLDKVPAGRT